MKLLPEVALSVRAPWWWFILHCGKDIENRDWPTRFRGRVWLHASKWWGKEEVVDDFHYAMTCFETEHSAMLGLDLEEPASLTELLGKIRSRGGCIVGSVEIVDCVKHSDSKWFNGEYGFVLRNPQPLVTPAPFKGALGFFNVPEAIRTEFHLGEKP